MTTYLLNSPVLTDYGHWKFERLEIQAAQAVLRGGFESAVGHSETADFLCQLLALEVRVNRATIRMKPGDQAIVFRLLMRLPENIVLAGDELTRQDFEFGRLTFLRQSTS